MASDPQWHGDRRALYEQLDVRRRQVSQELQLRMARIRENGSNVTPANEGEDGDSSEIDVVLVEIATATLHRIEQAIERLEGGRYGVCAHCHGPITASRLKVMPFAVYCRACETMREREEKAAREPARGRHSEGGLAVAEAPSGGET